VLLFCARTQRKSPLLKGRPASCVPDSAEAIRNEYFRVRSKLIGAGIEPQIAQAVAMKFYEVFKETSQISLESRRALREAFSNAYNQFLPRGDLVVATNMAVGAYITTSCGKLCRPIVVFRREDPGRSEALDLLRRHCGGDAPACWPCWQRRQAAGRAGAPGRPTRSLSQRATTLAARLCERAEQSNVRGYCKMHAAFD
jgi:hypothetical protein